MKWFRLTQGGLLLALFFLVGCAGFQNGPGKVNAFYENNQLPQAKSVLDQGPKTYGANNQLLFWVDKGLVNHYLGQYEESIQDFAQAKRLVDQYYGKSSREIAGSWLVNDFIQRYRLDDHDVLMIDVFQALNYAMLGQWDEALVDMRDADQRLKLIEGRAKQDKSLHYRDDAFARWLMGMLWEREGSSQSINDAAIAYSRSAKVYQEDYAKWYGLNAPRFLHEKAQLMNDAIDGKRIRSSEGEVYVLQYLGLIGKKVESFIVLPLDSTHFTRVSFAEHQERPNAVKQAYVVATSEGRKVSFKLEPMQPLDAMAKDVLEQRRAWIMTKGVSQAALKMAGAYVIEEAVRQNGQEWQAQMIALIGSVYALVSNRADTRSWLTLPREIQVGRLVLPEGEWELSVENRNAAGQIISVRSLDAVHVKAGEKQIKLIRTLDD